MDSVLPRMMEAAGVTEELKATDQMKWVGPANALKAQAEEIFFKNLYLFDLRMNIGIDLMFILWLSTFCILLAAIRLSAEIVLKNYRPVHNLLPVKFPKYLNRLQSISVGLALFSCE